MQDDDDTLRKADEFLRRHMRPRSQPVQGNDVPTLTDMITPGGPPKSPPILEDLPGGGPADPIEEEPTDDVIDEITQAVKARLTRDLEFRLTQDAVAEIHASVAAAVEDLEQEIKDAVVVAVAEAITRRPNL